MRTGAVQLSATSRATLPMSHVMIPLVPRLPTTMRSASVSAAVSVMILAGRPFLMWVVTLRLGWVLRVSSAAWSRVFCMASSSSTWYVGRYSGLKPSTAMGGRGGTAVTMCSWAFCSLASWAAMCSAWVAGSEPSTAARIVLNMGVCWESLLMKVRAGLYLVGGYPCFLGGGSLRFRGRCVGCCLCVRACMGGGEGV